MITFLIGAIVGAVVMTLVYRNNTALMANVADRLNKKIAEAKDKIKGEKK